MLIYLLSTSGNNIQPSNELRNLLEFSEDRIGEKVVEFELSVIAKPGDSCSSNIRGLQVKMIRNNRSYEVTMYT